MAFTCNISTNVLVPLIAPTSGHSQVLKMNNSCGTARGSYLKIVFSYMTLNFYSFIHSVGGMVLLLMWHSGIMHTCMIYQFCLENAFWLMLTLEHLMHFLFCTVVSGIMISRYALWCNCMCNVGGLCSRIYIELIQSTSTQVIGIQHWLKDTTLSWSWSLYIVHSYST